MPDSVRQQMHAYARRELAVRAKRSGLAYFVLWPLCSISNQFYIEHLQLTLLLTFCLFSAMAARLYILHKDPALSKPYNNYFFEISSVISAFVWGIFVACVVYLYGLRAQDMVIWIAAIAISSTSIHTFAPHKSVNYYYQIAMIVPIILSTLISRIEISLFLPISILFYLIFISQMFKQITKEYWEGIQNQFQLMEKTQALREARDQAVEAMEVRSRFLANMSHEIRTPMNGILGMLELLKAEKLSDEQSQLIDTAARSGEVLLRLLNDILDLSKLQANQLHIEQYPFNIHQLASDIHGLNLANVQGKQCDLLLSLSSDLPEFIQGDYLRLWQVLNNLVANAIKFTEKGQIVLEIKLLSKDGNRYHIHFSIKDTGIGIEKELHQRIFDPFLQADQSTTRQYGGTGLGLNISKRIVEAMGSHIELESAPGQGSHFMFNIYFDAVESVHAPPSLDEERTKVSDSSHKILIVEDNKVNQMVLEGFLRKLHLECDVANNGVEAIKLLKEQAYNLIFMDIQMPVMDGFDTLKAIQTDHLSDSPIIALTAHALEEDRQKCLAQGFSAYLSKPVQFEILKNNISQWLT